ncbi:metallophosphoesterase [Acidisoma cladoniae]|jgi:serine/threonine protein phosphatase 1|uniref:metallophosphoesterase n=1 Tax=Acidisoma cladoniae TaxID=3040935 RepID=UPI002550B355|nr:metallophosphoesterase [Acidisoma sp. PAMC 29798]
MISFLPAPATLPPDLRIYAIGDVHGCDVAHAAILNQIAEDHAARPVAEAIIIHLGDLIDRGPDSAAVLARVAAGSPIGGEMINLRGNHEELCLEALEFGGESMRHWRRNGGDTCLTDWGIPKRPEPPHIENLIPPDQMAVLRGEKLSYQRGGYIFVHAGIRPGVPIDAQDPHDLVWIRQPFLSWPEPLAAVVVHGHTPKDDPTVRVNRIGIDTGAVYGGRLTALVLEDSLMSFIQVPGPKKPRK